MIAIPTNHADVLTAVVARLRSELVLSESTCFLSNTPEPVETVNHDFFITVSPADGDFDGPTFEGAAENCLIEHAVTSVTIFVRKFMDRAEHVTAMLTDATGVLNRKRQVLKALAGHDLKDSGGHSLLVAFVEPTKPMVPLRGEKIGDCQLFFATPFQWDLAAAY